MRLKRLLIKVFLLLVIPLFLVSVIPKINADAQPITYQPFNNLILLVDYNQDTILFYSRGTINSNGIITYVNNNNIVELDFDTPYSGTLEINNLYLIRRTGSEVLTEYIISYNEYLLMYGQGQYVLGYQSSLDNTTIEVYQNGYDAGYESGYNYGQEIGYDNGYSNGSADSFQDGYDNGYQQGLNEGALSDTQFDILSLLGSIFLFPFKVLAIGFDVEIFGVNIGQLITAVFLISLAFGIIAIIRGKQ